MSIKRRGGDEEANYFYRFMYKGHSFCEGGYRTKAQAEEGERLAMNKAITQNLHPDDYAGEMTFRQAGEWWKKNRLPEKRSGKGDIGMLNLTMDYFDKQLIRAIEPEMIDEFLGKLQELRNAMSKRHYHVGPHTRNHYRALIHAIYERLKFKRMYKGENPVAFVDKIQVPLSRTRFIYPAEEKILTPAVQAEPDIFDYYLLGVELGMRIGEMRKIRIKHIDLIMKNIFIPHPKNNKSRHVPFDSADWDPGHIVMGLFKRRMAGKGPEDFLMPRWSYSYILEHFKAICEAVGLRLEKGEAIHLWRHTFACHRLSHGHPLYLVSRAMGHSSNDVTEKHYGHLELTDLAAQKRTKGSFTVCNQFATAEKILENSSENYVEK